LDVRSEIVGRGGGPASAGTSRPRSSGPRAPFLAPTSEKHIGARQSATCPQRDRVLGIDREVMARPERFELPTPGFVGRCSIQLSYGRAFGGAGPVGRAPASPF